MVINSILLTINYFVDPDLREQILFEKEEATENGCIDFEIGGIGTSKHLYWRLKKITCRACLRFY